MLIFNDGGGGRTGAIGGSLAPYSPVGIPVAMVNYQIGLDFYTQYNAGASPTARSSAA